MPRRRSLALGIAGGALQGLGKGLSNEAEQMIRDKERREAFELQVLPMREQAYREGRGEDLDKALAGLAKSYKANLGQLPQPTPQERLAPIQQRIRAATTPEQVPNEGEILQSVTELPNSAKMLTPGYGETADYAGGPEGELPSKQYGPVQPPHIQQLLSLAQNVRGQRIAGENAAAERGFARGEEQKSRAFPAELQRTLGTERAVTEQRQDLADKYAPRELTRKLTEAVTLETNPEIRKAKMNDAISVQAAAQKLQKDWGPLINGGMGTLPYDQPIYGTDGKVRYTVPAGSTGILWRDQYGTPVGFQGLSGGLPSGNSFMTPEMRQHLQQLMSGHGGQGNVPSAQPMTPGQQKVDALQKQFEEINSRIQELQGKQ